MHNWIMDLDNASVNFFSAETAKPSLLLTLNINLTAIIALVLSMQKTTAEKTKNNLSIFNCMFTEVEES